MGDRTSNNNPSLSIDQPWFQFFWKVIVALIGFVAILLVLRLWKLYQYRNVLPAHRNPASMFMSNQQAMELWGAEPGVIVSGVHNDNTYKKAVAIGNFGGNDVTLPEIAETTLTVHKILVATPQNSEVVVADRAETSRSESSTSEIVEALPYIDDSRKIKEALV